MKAASRCNPGNIKYAPTIFQIFKKDFCIFSFNSGLIFHQIVRMVTLNKDIKKVFFYKKATWSPIRPLDEIRSI